MENLSIPTTNGEDPIAEIMPRVEDAQVMNAADRIIEAYGSDRSTDDRIMQEAEWHDDEDNKYRMKRTIHNEKTWIFIDVYKSLQNDKPFLKYGFCDAPNGGAQMYHPDDTTRKRLPIDKAIVETDIIDCMVKSGLVSPEKATSDQEDAKFWDMAIETISEQEAVRWAVKQGHDLPVYVGRDKIYDKAREIIEKQEPGLPRRAVDRIIDLALASVYPKYLPELPAASTDTE